MGKKHGYRYHPLYATWCNMKSRCNNHNHPQYKDYGGRGIGYCVTWECFPSFLKDVGKKPFPEASLDRIDNDGNYTIDNIQWVHKDVNFMKRTYNQEYFIDMCSKIAANSNLTEPKN